jgi:hypothetical protein
MTSTLPVSDSRIPTDTMLDSLPTLALAADCPRCVWRDYGVHGLDHFADNYPDRIDETGRELLRPLLIAAWRRHGYHVTLLCHHDCAADLGSVDGPSDEVYVAVRQEAAGLTDEYRRTER